MANGSYCDYDLDNLRAVLGTHCRIVGTANFVDCNTKVVRASPSDLGGALSISVSASSLLQKLYQVGSVEDFFEDIFVLVSQQSCFVGGILVDLLQKCHDIVEQMSLFDDS